MPGKAITSLFQHMDLEWMIEAFRRTRKDGAVGIDSQTGADYEVNLEANLQSLLERAKSGDHYKAPPVRRAYIPKDDGATRSLGIPTFEDKVLQRAVVMLLEPLYEQDFLDCSYGYRPGRSTHQALEEVRSKLTCMGGGWILEVDISKFFDTLVHKHLREILVKRMRDGVITRLIGKWLKAGVMEDGAVTYPEEGSPQGGVISPMLSNIYLHEVVDVWFERTVKPRLKGRAFLVRYADDVVMGFASEDDARRVMAVLSERFGRYGLTLHPSKTRLVEFRSPRFRKDPPNGDGSGSFYFLGFTLYWAKSLKGNWVVKLKTSKKRFARGLKRIKEWCRFNRHLSIREQQEMLARKLKGHYGYFGVTGNFRCVARFLDGVCRIWRNWLSRRSQKARMNWAKFKLLLKRYPLPPATLPRSIYRAAANP